MSGPQFPNSEKVATSEPRTGFLQAPPMNALRFFAALVFTAAPLLAPAK